MKVLFLTPDLPYPPRKGTALRNYHLMKNLAANHEIHLLSFASQDRTEDTKELGRYCASICTVPFPRRSAYERFSKSLFSSLPDLAHRLASPLFFRELRALRTHEKYDIVQVEGLEMGPYARTLSRMREGRSPVIILDEHNAEYVLQRTAYQTDKSHIEKWPRAVYSLIQWRKLRHYERLVCREADAVLTVSREDSQALAQLQHSRPIYVVPNGVDTQVFAYRAPVESQEANIVFTGTMDFRPNVDAMSWFCRDILPLIIPQVHSLRLFIVGKNPTPEVRRWQGSHVEVTGAVEDVRPYLARSRVCVVPMRMGAGMRLKVLEAMAAGVPVVSTPLGIQGIDLIPGREVLVAQDARSFATRVSEVVTNHALARELAQSARQRAENEYDWRAIVPGLESIYARVTRKETNILV